MISHSLLRLFPAAAVGAFLAAVGSADGRTPTISHHIADGFDFPVGKPDAVNYRKARGFYPNGHLGEDWNGKGGGDTDLGDPIYSIAHGVVVFSQDYKLGWGNVVIIRHAYREKNGQIAFIDSLYGHLKVRMVREGQKVARGEQIGTMGKGPRGMYLAHLHFEIRKNLAVGMNRSDFKRDYSVYHSPTHFIEKYRRLRPEYRRVAIPVDTFRKSNPNLLTMDRVATPDSSGWKEISSSSVPSSVKSAIKTHTDDESADTEKKDGFWNRLMGFLGQGFKKKEE